MTNGSRWATALMARADEVGQFVDRRFAELGGQALATAGLATLLIGRWLATGEAASTDDEARLDGQGEQAILENTRLDSVAKAYLAWRDCTIAVLGRGGDAPRDRGGRTEAGL